MEKLAYELEKGQTFRIKGKKRKYLIEDIFLRYETVLVFCRVSKSTFSKTIIPRHQIVIIL